MREMAKAAVAATLPYDFVISPTSSDVAYPAEWAMQNNDPYNAMAHIGFTVAYNMSEQPAATVNCGYNLDGLPIGLQIAGRRFDDLGVLSAAMALEVMRAGEARPWPEPPDQPERKGDVRLFQDVRSFRPKRAGDRRSERDQPRERAWSGRPRRRVFVADLDLALAEDAAKAVKAEGGAAEALKVDMRDKASIEAAAQKLGALDALVVTPSINVRKPLLDLTDDEFDRVVDLNLKGVFRVLRAFAPAMAARGKGSIVAFSSVRAQVVEPGQGVYAATKAGTLQMIRALAAELGPSGVRLNAVAPGVVETPLTKRSSRTRPGIAPTPTNRC